MVAGGQGERVRADEIRSAGRLAGHTLRAGTQRIAELHSGIADRAFGAVGPAAAPVKAVHDAIAGLAYFGVRTGLDLGARAAGLVAAARAADEHRLDEDRAGGVALAVLNGAHGDLVARRAPGLAVPMS